MKKITFLFLIVFKVSTLFSQGNQFIAKQDGLVMTMNVEYYNTIEACTFTKGDQYKVTIYLMNQSGKKILPDFGSLPIVEFSGSSGDCDGNPYVKISINLPMNPGDIQSNVGYCTIKAGEAASTIIVNQYIFRGYKVTK